MYRFNLAPFPEGVFGWQRHGAYYEMTTAIRITKLDDSKKVVVTEVSKNGEADAPEAIAATLEKKGDEHTVYVHGDNAFRIEELD